MATKIAFRKSADEVIQINVPGDLKVKESNGLPYACCPTCGRMYALLDDQLNAHDLPGKCRRCGGPMDAAKAVAFGDEFAAREHEPALAVIGAKMRAIVAG